MNVNERKAGVIISYVQIFAGIISMLIYTPFMLRLMGQSEYGIYNLAHSMVSYLAVLDFGFQSTYTRFYMKYKTAGDTEGVKRINGTFLLIFLFFSFLAIIAGTIVTSNAHLMFDAKLTAIEVKKTKIVMGLMVFNIAANFPSKIFSSYLRGNERYVFFKCMQLIKTILNPFVMLPVLFMGGRSVGMAIVTVSLSLAMEYSFVIYSVTKLKMRFSFRGISLSEFWEIGKFSFFVFLNMIIDQVNANVDNFLLGMYHGTKAVAIYGVASNLRSYFKTFTSAISLVFIPRIHKLVNNGRQDRELSELFARVGRLQFYIIAILTIGFIFFGKEFMIMWGGKEYEEAYIVTVILFVIAVIPMIQSLGEEIQRAKNCHKYRTLIYGVVVMLNVLLSIPLCKKYGILGCTIGTAVASIFGKGIVMNIFFYKKLKLDTVYFWKEIGKILPGMIIPSILGVLMMKFAPLENIVVFGGCALLFIIVCCISIWCISLNNYEKNLVTDLVKKLIRR